MHLRPADYKAEHMYGGGGGNMNRCFQTVIFVC